MKKQYLLIMTGVIALIALFASCVGGPGPAAQDSKVLAFQTFEDGTGFTAGINAAAEIDKSGANANSKQCVKFSFEATGDPGDAAQCVNVASMDGKPVDTTPYKYLIFFILDTQGANTHKVSVADAADQVYSGWVDVKSKKDNWVKIAMPLRGVSGIDRKAVKEIRIGEWNAGTYFIDNVYLAAEKTDELK